MSNYESSVHLQNSIDEMFLWIERWLLEFKKDKCKVLNLGKNNPHHKYNIDSDIYSYPDSDRSWYSYFAE